MDVYDDMSRAGVVARVRSVSDDGYRLYLEARNGQTFTLEGRWSTDYPKGSLVYIQPESNEIEIAPDDLWPEEPWLGVVRLKLPDVTVVDSNGRWRLVPTHSNVNYSEGNTVEVTDFSGILRVLSESPLKSFDMPSIDDTIIENFKAEVSSSGLTFSDFGGLEHVVKRARELIELPLRHKEALSKIGARPIKGVLFTGAPGTGKTMLARIIANSAGAIFYEISGPEIFSKWYGQTEEVLRRLFADAAKQTRAIIFFDEIDSVAGQRGDGSHEASRRVVAQLLTLMDGFTTDNNVVVIATTNRPQDIDAALRRPGRFDWEINFPLPNFHDRKSILHVAVQRLNTEEQLPHDWVAQNTESWSAAELTAIWSEAALIAVADNRSAIMAEDYVGGWERVAAQRRRVMQESLGGDSV